MSRFRPDPKQGVYLGETRGRAIPREHGKRGCLCADSNTYSRECCKGALIGQGIGQTQSVRPERGAFSNGFSDGFDIGDI